MQYVINLHIYRELNIVEYEDNIRYALLLFNVPGNSVKP